MTEEGDAADEAAQEEKDFACEDIIDVKRIITLIMMKANDQHMKE